MFVRTADGSIVDDAGKVMYFSPRRFEQQICAGDGCFICGADRARKAFNDEHILPDWILRRFTLHAERIILPTGQARTYGGYTIPCCAECNFAMASYYEHPIRTLIEAGTDRVLQHVRAHGPWLIFAWLCLIFIKTHLKDREYRVNLDRRKGNATIADAYIWRDLHRAHCIARGFHTNCAFDPKVCGTLFIFNVPGESEAAEFDFGDLYEAQTVILRLGETVFISVLNDSGFALNLLAPELNGAPAALSPIALREIMARCADINLRLRTRPTFSSHFRLRGVVHSMHGRYPKQLAVDPPDAARYGQLLHVCCAEQLARLPARERERLAGPLKAGTVTFFGPRFG